MKTWKDKGDFMKLLLKDSAVSGSLSKEEIEECFDVRADLKNVDRIFERVFS